MNLPAIASPAPASAANSTPLWRELAVAGLLSVAAAVLAGVMDLHESLYALTRRWERVQLDEVPIALFVFACCVMLLYARRYRQARRELQARQAAEAALARALEDNRDLAREHLAAQESERKHFARELHDELGQYLNAIKIDAVALASANATDSVAAGARIVGCADHVHAAVSDMIRRLRPVGLDELGLAAALEHCVDQWRRRLPDLQISLQLQGALEGLGEAVDLVIYRVVQEALTNAGRHARAACVDVRVRRHEGGAGAPSRIELSVSDDGAGLAADRAQGFGLRGMQERVSLVGGTFELRGTPGQGVHITAVVPLADERR
jgi:signal transduction histidine kinase